MKVPEGWKLCRIGEVLERVVDPVKVDTLAVYREIGIRSHGKGIFHKRPIEGRKLGNKRVFRVKPACLILNIVFAWEQAVALTSETEKGLIASHRFPMFREKDSGLLPEYAWRYFLTERGKSLLELASPGGAGRNKTLGQTEFSRSWLLVPPRAEQLGIVEILAEWDKAIENVGRLIKAKQRLKCGLLQRLLNAALRFLQFRGEWETKRLGELFTFSGGYSASREQLSTEGHCYLHYGDIHKSTKAFIDVMAEDTDIPKLDVSLTHVAAGSLLDDGDVVFVDASEDDEGTSKHVVIVNKDKRPFISGLHTIVAKSKTDELAHEYRRYCFQTPAIRKQFLFYSVGTKVSGISKSNIPKLKLPFPGVPEQMAIAEVLMALDENIDELKRLSGALAKQKRGLMQKLLTGRIRVNVRAAPTEVAHV